MYFWSGLGSDGICTWDDTMQKQLSAGTGGTFAHGLEDRGHELVVKSIDKDFGKPDCRRRLMDVLK